ncbi:MAG TPA: rhodanese-like domain-containing protein [Glaciihabitans sp.]|jgi:thiosulfate/3-mercaptopyruvate sulfurtransferase|nr:rhodanese-like domain-containing protein [Glaciihabitans sp.]
MTLGPTLLDPVVSTQWLADYLGADNLVVLDATVLATIESDGHAGYRSGHESYLVNGHVPDAQFADVITALSDPTGLYPFTHPETDRFASVVGALGIDNDSTVVVYDSVVGQWASRVWWLFRAAGYDRVAVLDGGLVKWLEEDRPLEFGHVVSHPKSFTASDRPHVWADTAYVEAVVRGEENAALVYATPLPHSGDNTVAGRRSGQIPGSLTVPSTSLIDGTTHTQFHNAQLKKTFAPVLTKPRIVVYCEGGITATAAALTLTILGHTQVSVYDGSLWEWAADANRQLVS